MKIHNWVVKAFEKKTFDTHSTANLPPEPILNSKSGFFQKTPNASSKKTKKKSAGLSKLLSTCPVELFDENNFLSFCEKFYIFLNNLGHLSKKFELSAKIFQQGCQNCIVRVQTNILEFSKQFFNFPKLERNWPQHRLT